MSNLQTELARYRYEKALHNLVIARDAFALNHFDEVVAKSYYAIFTAMRSLLALKKIDSKRHSGVIALFNQHFIQEKLFPKGFNKIITEAKKIREHADYGDFVDITKETAQYHLSNAELFVRNVEDVLRKLMLQLNHNNS